MNNYNPSCAVLIATHNGESFLREQINSINNQIRVDVEIFHSDDDSNDGTRDLLAEYASTNLNLDKKVFKNAALNFFHLIKSFPESSKYDYYALSDQDDIWLPNKLESAIDCILSENVDVYSGSYYTYDQAKNKLQYVNKSFEQTKYSHYFRSPGPGFTYVFSARGFNILREVITAEFDNLTPIIWHDWALYAVAKENNLDWFIDDKAHTLYRLHSNNHTGQLNSVAQLRRRLHFLFHGEYRNQIILLQRAQVHLPFAEKISRFSLLDRLALIRFVKHMRSSLHERVVLILWILFGG
jgi:rhamnosyltransferase